MQTSKNILSNSTAGTATLAEERSFDAWGRLRNPTNWTYTSVPAMSLTNRGFTGHEHLPAYGIINMNGRVYDPVVARFLSADNFVQAPDNTQSFNRYSYAFNNPLKYTDPSGWEWTETTIGLLADMGGQWGQMANQVASTGNYKEAREKAEKAIEEKVKNAKAKLANIQSNINNKINEIKSTATFQKVSHNVNTVKTNVTNYFSNIATAANNTYSWATGNGEFHKIYYNDRVANSFRDARVINQVRDYWYNQVNAGNKTINEGVTNFRGRKAWTGGNFGAMGVISAGIDPIEQYVGSFTPDVISDGIELTYIIKNTTSFKSLLYGIAPDWERSQWKPGGNIIQYYIFTEPIDFKRINQ